MTYFPYLGNITPTTSECEVFLSSTCIIADKIKRDGHKCYTGEIRINMIYILRSRCPSHNFSQRSGGFSVLQYLSYLRKSPIIARVPTTLPRCNLTYYSCFPTFGFCEVDRRMAQQIFNNIEDIYITINIAKHVEFPSKKAATMITTNNLATATNSTTDEKKVRYLMDTFLRCGCCPSVQYDFTAT